MQKKKTSPMCANKLQVKHAWFLNIEDLCDPFPSKDYINFTQLQAKIPSNYHETICHIGCRTKMQDEYNSIFKNNTWDHYQQTRYLQQQSTWVFKAKRITNG